MDNTIFKRTEQLDLFGNTERDNIELSLKDKFIIPPFTIFDCRQGYWLNRKRVWLSLGIKSEIGREDTKTIMQSLKKWTDNKRESGDLQGNKLPSGVSIFDPVLCEICYKWFNLTGGQY